MPIVFKSIYGGVAKLCSSVVVVLVHFPICWQFVPIIDFSFRSHQSPGRQRSWRSVKTVKELNIVVLCWTV